MPPAFALAAARRLKAAHRVCSAAAGQCQPQSSRKMWAKRSSGVLYSCQGLVIIISPFYGSFRTGLSTLPKHHYEHNFH